MAREITEIRVNERGEETHESWILIRANRVQSSGTRLFDSEILHRELIMVEITRCRRRRELNRDWKFATEVLLECEMSPAQWGAFVSSFGVGTGVPATLTRYQGEVPGAAPAESRLDQSHQEVRQAGVKALSEVQDSYEKLLEAFESGGKRVQREALRDLGIRLGNAPLNMEYAATSLTEHAENVVTKARADIEAMVLMAAEHAELASGDLLQLGSGEPPETGEE